MPRRSSRPPTEHERVTVSPPAARPHPSTRGPAIDSTMKPDSGVSVTQRLVLPPPPVLSASPAGGPQSPSMAAPSLLALPIGRTIAMSSDGVLLVQTGGEPSQAFAGRLEALRVLSGSVTARVLHRRSREGETMEVMGRLGSPIVRLAGAGQLVFGPRPGRRIVLLALERDPAFLREDLLLGFELTLAFENGRIALEAAGESGRPPGEAGATALVQLRGAGAFALELEGQLASVRTSPGRPLLVRREWIVGWLGRLVARAVPSDESPSGQRGLVAFSGDGTVLVTPS